MTVPVFLVESLLKTLGKTLQELPNTHLQSIPPKESSQGYEVDMQVLGKPFRTVLELKKTLYPADVKQILWQFMDSRRRGPTRKESDNRTPFLGAEIISQGAKALLKKENVGYFDGGGSLFFPAAGVYLDVVKADPKPLVRRMRSLFAGRRAQVVHCLLIRPRGTWSGVKDLAQQALVSPATVSEVLTELERMEIAVAQGQGPAKKRMLPQPAALLEAWTRQLPGLRPPPQRKYSVPVGSAGLLEMVAGAFKTHGVAYAVSGEAAAQRLFPAFPEASQVSCRLAAGPSVDAALQALGASAAASDSGANVTVIDSGSQGGALLGAHELDGVWLADPVRIYLDLLLGEGARCKAMAERVRKESIQF